jgi:type IX secretion system PorP/SprF family membrane protein
MRRIFLFIFTGWILIGSMPEIRGQENVFSHYFVTTSSVNPAHTGDTRFAQLKLAERIMPTTANVLVTNTFLSYDQKLRNHRSGIGICIDQQTAKFREQQAKISYSYTLLLFKRYWVKAGLGVSLNALNTYASGYRFPDQYDRYGFTGDPTQETFENEKALYPGLSAGFTVYNEFSWFSFGMDNMNQPGIEILGEQYLVPMIINADWGLLVPLDKNKRPRRIFSPNGGLKPYSSIGPVVTFYKNGPFHQVSLGINAFTNPAFWGVSFRYHALYDQYITGGAAALNFLAGYRVEFLSIAYSYDFIVNRTPTNYK